MRRPAAAPGRSAHGSACKDAGTEGAVGPVLNELKPTAERVASALKTGVGVMPAYSGSLSSAQIEALALYVAKASGAAK